MCEADQKTPAAHGPVAAATSVNAADSATDGLRWQGELHQYHCVQSLPEEQKLMTLPAPVRVRKYIRTTQPFHSWTSIRPTTDIAS
jgi:hypothetical protein